MLTKKQKRKQLEDLLLCKIKKVEAKSSVFNTTAPSNPKTGDCWFNTNTGQLFIYYGDGHDNQWVNYQSIF